MRGLLTLPFLAAALSGLVQVTAAASAAEMGTNCGKLPHSPKFTDSRMRGCESAANTSKSTERADIAAMEVQPTDREASQRHCGTLPFSPKAADMRMHGCQPAVSSTSKSVERADIASLESAEKPKDCGVLPFSPKFADMRLRDCAPRRNGVELQHLLPR